MEKILENINREISNGYVELEENNDTVAACNMWLKAWDILNESTDKRIEAIEDFEEIYEYNFNESLENWVQDLEMELENAAIDNEEYYEKRIKYCKEFCCIFPESDEFIIMSMELAQAESMFELGKKEESEQLFENISTKYKCTVWPYIKWGDCYWIANILHKNNSLIDLEKAEEIYRKGLNIDNESDSDILEERLEELLSIKGRIKK